MTDRRPTEAGGHEPATEAGGHSPPASIPRSANIPVSTEAGRHAPAAHIPVSTSEDGQVCLWEPTAGERERAWLTGFMRWVSEREGRTFAEYEQLREWSVTELERFWASIWEYFGVRCSRPYERVLDARTMPGARWFEGAELNYAENMLCDRRTGDERDPGAIAVLHASELRSEPARPADMGRAVRAGGGGGRRTARAGREAGGSRGRLHAQHPRDADRVPGDGQRGRDLLERGAGVRGAQRDRPLRADHAEGGVRGGRLPPRRQGLRP